MTDLVEPVLVTGVAGFIGMHTARTLLAAGHRVIGVDNLNDYYDPRLKLDRLELLVSYGAFDFWQMDLADRSRTAELFSDAKPGTVIHLAAQAGVRYSIQNPAAYIDSNLVAFGNILEGCRNSSVGHLVYASSSSVYGANVTMPFSVDDSVDHPVSLYAATKKANELMAHTYSHLFGLPTTGLRFFTVYGPWGRPDMAPILFAQAIFEGRPIDVFNHGQMSRDFTFIDDIVEGVIKVAAQPARPHEGYDPAHPHPGRSTAPYRVYNIGNNTPVALLDFISVLERHIGRPAVKVMRPMQPGDVPATFADIDDLEAAVGFRPRTDLDTGLARFVDWYRSHHVDRRK